MGVGTGLRRAMWAVGVGGGGGMGGWGDGPGEGEGEGEGGLTEVRWEWRMREEGDGGSICIPACSFFCGISSFHWNQRRRGEVG